MRERESECTFPTYSMIHFIYILIQSFYSFVMNKNIFMIKS